MFFQIKSKLTFHAVYVSLKQAAIRKDKIALDFSQCHLPQMGMDRKCKKNTNLRINIAEDTCTLG